MSFFGSSTSKTPIKSPSAPKTSPYQLKVGTGSAFTAGMSHGIDPLAKNIKSTVKSGKSSYFSNISKADRGFFHNLIAKHAKNLPTGAGFSYSLRKNMKEEVEKARISGKISKLDAGDFKNMIDSLPQ